MKREKLTKEELEQGLVNLTDWKEENGSIEKKYSFANFAESLEFVNKVGALAEEADHHPDICFGWGFADITLTTHDRGGVTDVDLVLAERINGI